MLDSLIITAATPPTSALTPTATFDDFVTDFTSWVSGISTEEGIGYSQNSIVTLILVPVMHAFKNWGVEDILDNFDKCINLLSLILRLNSRRTCSQLEFETKMLSDKQHQENS